ncbi:MAG: hypothetical protein ACE5K1_12410 [Acidiferrobacterales bacterium]
MRVTYPQPADVGVTMPESLQRERFCAGFRHALKGRQLSEAEHLKRSFRLGYREAKLYLRELRRRQGIVNFPIQGRFKIKVQH